jgi:hypothetical protein
MARKFTLQPLRRYDVKPPEKTAQDLTFEVSCLQKTNQQTPGLIQVPLGPQPDTLPMRHTFTCKLHQSMRAYTCFSSNFTSSVIFRIIRSKAKFFKFDVNLSFIKRDDFFRANVNNFTVYTEHAGEA